MKSKKTVEIAISAIGAALYGVGALITISVVLGPLGIATLRPAIVIPMAIACLFGYKVGFICGALGNFLADFIVYGLDPGEIPGIIASGFGAVITVLFVKIAEKRYKSEKTWLGFAILGSNVGLAWFAGFAVGFGNQLIGYIPTAEIAIIVAITIGIGNSIWACTIFPPIVMILRRYLIQTGFIKTTTPPEEDSPK